MTTRRQQINIAFPNSATALKQTIRELAAATHQSQASLLRAIIVDGLRERLRPRSGQAHCDHRGRGDHVARVFGPGRDLVGARAR